MSSSSLSASEFNPYYSSYIEKAQSFDLLKGLEESKEEIVELLNSIPEAKQHYSYAEGKWTTKEVVQHLLDSERVFAYRALRIGRGDKTPLPGFEQDDYIVPSNANKREWHEMIEEYKIIRRSSQILFETFTSEQLLYMGSASGSNVSVRALGYIIIGHEQHHALIIRSRYL